MQLKLFSVIILFFAQTLQTYGQTLTPTVDTVNIYKSKTGVPFRAYEFEWCLLNITTFSGSEEKMNKQDSLVINYEGRIYPPTPLYFKIYNKKNKLLFEGGRRITESDFDGAMRGDIKYYYRSGQLKRIEHKDCEYYIDTCDKRIKIGHGIPKPEGTWKFFRRDGSIIKRFDYSIEVKSCIPLSYSIVRQTTKYKKDGTVKSVKSNEQ